MKTLAELEQRLQALTDEIREAKDRLPAHSVKQQVMAALLDLEDEYDLIMKQVRDLKEGD